MRKILLISFIFAFCTAAFGDTQDYVKGRVMLIKSDQAYFDVGEKEGVAPGQNFEIYFKKDIIASGKIAWADSNISRSAVLDKAVLEKINRLQPLTVKIRLYIAQAQRGGFLSIACLSHPEIEPSLIRTPDDIMVSRLIHRGLLSRSEDGEIIPDLARDYEIRDLTYTFYLDPEATFHSGKSVEASDVAFSLEQLAISEKLTNGSCFVLEIRGADDFRHGITNEIAGIIIIDPTTISITLKEPFPAFEEYLAGPGGYIIPKPGPISSNGVMDGAGIYRIKWRDHDEIVLEPFKSVQGALLDSIRFEAFKNSDEAALSLELGHLDLIPIYGEPSPKFLSKANYKFDDVSTGGYALLGINCSRDFQQEQRLGRALSFLIDRDAIIRVIMAGSAQKPVFVTPDKKDSGVAFWLPLSSDSAKACFDSLTELPSTLTLFIDINYPILTKVARYIEGQLSRKKIKLVEKPADFRTLDETVARNDMDLYLTYFQPIGNGPACIFTPLLNNDLSGQTNCLFFSDTVTQSFVDALTAETDPDRRDNLAIGIAHTITSNPPAIMLYQPYLTVISKSDISGLIRDSVGCLDLRKVSLEASR